MIIIINFIQYLKLIEQLQSDLEKSKSNVSEGEQKKRPMLGMIPKTASGEVLMLMILLSINCFVYLQNKLFLENFKRVSYSR